MASMGGGGFLDPEPYVRKVKTGGMLNQTLKNICAAEDMKLNGVKAELQSRIVDSTSRVPIVCISRESR